MTRKILAVVALSLGTPCLVASPAAAQTLEEVVAAHLAARGGVGSIRAVQSLRMTGHASAEPGTEAPVTREVRRPGRIRTEFSFQGVTGVYVLGGDAGWQVSPFGGSLEPEPMTADQEQAARDQADIDGPFIDASAKGLTLELTGRTTLDGRETYRVKVTSKGGNVRDYYIDATSRLIVRVDSTRVVRGTPMHVETTYTDYREVAGLMFAHAIEAGERGRPRRLRVVVDTVEVNPPIEEARFATPAGLKTPTAR
jgi:hypothetical protein